ncbi:unnamed protein product [Clonostachys rhizophaga]|uniref:Uncharacterized protein n=1 Tax=Clonostachys rhizophaga TaxID=160324 RepID=A0A9N9V3X7_9HYPO|nr:unnamed protein product [Clonostachys rhizophaga]
MPLPIDGDASTEVPNEIDDPVDIEAEIPDADLPDEDDFDDFAVPNLLADQTKLEELHNIIRQQESSASRPLDEARAPTRRPEAEMLNIREAEFVELRVRSIKYDHYLQFAMKWYDGRFARHHAFDM